MASVQAMECSRRCGFETPAYILDTFPPHRAFAIGIGIGKLLAVHKAQCGGRMRDAPAIEADKGAQP